MAKNCGVKALGMQSNGCYKVVKVLALPANAVREKIKSIFTQNYRYE